jgi:hypothetical protein
MRAYMKSNSIHHHHIHNLFTARNNKKINPINKKETKLLQQLCGKFLYYARAVDTTMLHALNDFATHTTKGTEKQWRH